MHSTQEDSAIPFAIDLFFKGLAVLKYRGDAAGPRPPKSNEANREINGIR